MSHGISGRVAASSAASSSSAAWSPSRNSSSSSQISSFCLPNDLAQIHCGLDHNLGLAATPGDFRLLANKVGGEQRLDGFFVQLGQFGWPEVAFEFFQVQLGFCQR